MTNLEIERKFLVKNDSYKSMAVGHYTIRQGYICRESGHTVRLRIRIDEQGREEAFLTIKSRPNANGFAHYEWEKSISMDDANLLQHMCLPGWIDKTRWLIPAHSNDTRFDARSLMWEVDEFHALHEGLVIAELELEDESQLFDKPSFLGDEVTGQPQYQNSNL